MNESPDKAKSRLDLTREGSEWMFPLATLVAIVFAALYVHYQPHKSSDVASWVQAIGSIAAIGGAIWIANRQYRDSVKLEQQRQDAAERAAQREVEAFIQAVREEIGTLWDGFNMQVGPTLRSLREGEPLDLIFPGSTEAFTIYHGNTAMVGKIGDAALRRQIVETYAIAHGVIYSLQLNNRMIGELEQVDIFYHQPDRDDVLRRKQQRLADYAPKMKLRYEMLAERVEALIGKRQSVFPADGSR
jgi:hypothetical protein